jgi:hypothetical protein
LGNGRRRRFYGVVGFDLCNRKQYHHREREFRSGMAMEHLGGGDGLPVILNVDRCGIKRSDAFFGGIVGGEWDGRPNYDCWVFF